MTIFFPFYQILTNSTHLPTHYVLPSLKTSTTIISGSCPSIPINRTAFFKPSLSSEEGGEEASWTVRHRNLKPRAQWKTQNTSKRWIGHWVHSLLFLRILVCFSVSTQRLTNVCNSSFRGSKYPNPSWPTSGNRYA